ncbi:MAG TPA: AraC family transcriptional regulator [Burkholderiaceae bacterium]|nr:AraC family transcriptional regulator [Burkholderiaceae bacterium]
MNTSTLSLREYGASHGSHAHAHFQVLVGLDGVLDLEVAGRGRRIAAGDGCVIPSGEHHDFEAASGSRCLVLDTSQAAWADCAADPAYPAQTQALAHYLASAVLKRQALAVHYGPLLLLESWGTPAMPQRARRRIDWLALAQWAQARWHLPLSVADLAAQVFLSASQFTQRCREENGTSAMQWLRAQRLLHAQQLRLSGVPVAQAARRTGYRSPSALTAALRQFRA